MLAVALAYYRSAHCTQSVGACLRRKIISDVVRRAVHDAQKSLDEDLMEDGLDCKGKQLAWP